MTFLSRKPRLPEHLLAGELVQWQARAISFVSGEKSPFGTLFLTDRRVIFDSLATAGRLHRHIEFARSDYRSIHRDHRPVGASWASGAWQQVVFTLQDASTVRVALHSADKKISYLAEQLTQR